MDESGRYYGKLKQEAIQQGLQQGMHVILLQQLQAKFGELPQVTIDRIQAIKSQEALTALATNVLTVESLADLGLNGAA